MTSRPERWPRSQDRAPILAQLRQWKMARSAHAYLRGNAGKFYHWLDSDSGLAVPQGPGIWICGDCHLGNLGPMANAKGRVDVQIRDLDQSVIGNPAHDLIRLGLSLATAARGSDLPGVTTARMVEQLIEGYRHALVGRFRMRPTTLPETVQAAMRDSHRRTWKNLATERIEDTRPTIPLGKHFWPLSKQERSEMQKLFETDPVRCLVTSLHSRDDNAPIRLLDAAFWVKGCSSLGRLRFSALVQVGKSHKDAELCLIDLKEAVKAAAPRHKRAVMPRDNGRRVVEGARHLAPFLGDRMLSTRFLGHSVFLRELRPQDLKLEIDQLSREEAMVAARFLAGVVGKAHARQLDAQNRRKWAAELTRNRSKELDAPQWLWDSIVELASIHEAAYLQHCRRYAADRIAA